MKKSIDDTALLLLAHKNALERFFYEHEDAKTKRYWELVEKELEKEIKTLVKNGVEVDTLVKWLGLGLGVRPPYEDELVNMIMKAARANQK